jgi:large subunit ribosomal protein L35
MPKIKTHKSASKRFKITKNGKVKRHSAYGRHLLTGKSSKRRRRLRAATILDPAETPRVKRMLPYD